jgi:hypothetical protein
MIHPKKTVAATNVHQHKWIQTVISGNIKYDNNNLVENHGHRSGMRGHKWHRPQNIGVTTVKKTRSYVSPYHPSGAPGPFEFQTDGSLWHGEVAVLRAGQYVQPVRKAPAAGLSSCVKTGKLESLLELHATKLTNNVFHKPSLEHIQWCYNAKRVESNQASG